jgi:NAD(P)-dependent dehydrogenase (short-subunit alcohol dehydrogenase family)
MKKLLLIGGSSAIGKSLSPLLNYEITSVDSKQFPLPTIPEFTSDFDIVINLAGLTLKNNLHKFHILNKKLIEVNCLGAVNILGKFLPAMRERKYGRIIFISSVLSEINIINTGLYSASKAFVDKLVKIAAIENGEYGITVNSIQLGYTGIGMSISTPDNMKKQIEKTALKRFCTMQELYNAIKFIIDTEYYTGQNLKLDGGIR